MHAAVHVIKPGMLTTVQDLGRWGLQARGVPVAGPMDPVSHRVANALVGNDARAATLEVTLLGPELEFEDERAVAVCGAAFELTVDGRLQATETRFVVSAASRLRFGARRGGARAYVAVAGGIDVPLTLGSRATHLVSRMGGIDGRAVKAGDRLPLGIAGVSDARLKPRATTLTDVARGFSRANNDAALIRVLPGPQADYFAPDALAVLQSAPYVVGAQSDRMGFRLEGPPLTHARGADIISDATPLGVLQVPASGRPILLMADRQTTGGYPKIATMISADVGAAGQLGPGDRVRFAVCAPQEAIAALIAQERALMALEAAAS
jgi:antagonist of KipI